MTYQPNIPQDSTAPSQSASDFRTNFLALNTIFGEDHIEFNNAVSADRGEHKKVVFNNVIDDPDEATPKASLYIKASPDTQQVIYIIRMMMSERCCTGNWWGNNGRSLVPI